MTAAKKHVFLLVVLAGCASKQEVEQDARSYLHFAGYEVLGVNCNVESGSSLGSCVVRLKDVPWPIPVTCRSDRTCKVDYSP